MVRLRSKSVTTPFASVPPKAVQGSSTAVGRSLLLREELRSCADAAHLQQTNGAGSAGRVESEPPHVGWGGLVGKGSSARE
jgi:hypothetical protein